jgi:hypothetical protein
MHKSLWSRRACLSSLALAMFSPLAAQGLRPGESVSLADLTVGFQVVGTHDFRYWGWLVYQARLQAAGDFRAQTLMQHPFALELTYARALRGQDIAERSISEMRALAQRTQQTWDTALAAQWQTTLLQVLPDVRLGDRITGVHLPQRGAAFFLNERFLGWLTDPAFSPLFFGVWLSPQSAQPQMRQALLSL